MPRRTLGDKPTTNVGEIDAVGVVDEAVEDRIGIGRVADHGMPFVDRDLAGDDGGAAPVAFLEDLVKIVAAAGIERFETPIVEDQELDTGQAARDPGIATVPASQRQIGEQLGDPLIEHRAVVAARPVAERTGQPTLADAGRSAHDQIIVRIDPRTIGELLEQGAVEAARAR